MELKSTLAQFNEGWYFVHQFLSKCLPQLFAFGFEFVLLWVSLEKKSLTQDRIENRSRQNEI